MVSDPEANKMGSIHLHARRLLFYKHPCKIKEILQLTASATPEDSGLKMQYVDFNYNLTKGIRLVITKRREHSLWHEQHYFILKYNAFSLLGSYNSIE